MTEGVAVNFGHALGAAHASPSHSEGEGECSLSLAMMIGPSEQQVSD